MGVTMFLPPEKAEKKSNLRLQDPPSKFSSRQNRVSQRLLAACSGGNIGVARACLRGPVKIDINFSDGASTPLTAALASNSNVLVQMVMDQKGVDVNKPACNKWTPLHLACLTGNIKAITRLGEHSNLNTVNSKDDEGETPIMLAVWEGNTEAVKEMVKIPGIDLNTTNKCGDTLVDVCRKRGFTDILSILQDEKGDGRQEIVKRDSLWRASERQKLKRRALAEDKENMDTRSYQNILQGKMTRLSLSP